MTISIHIWQLANRDRSSGGYHTVTTLSVTSLDRDGGGINFGKHPAAGARAELEKQGRAETRCMRPTAEPQSGADAGQPQCLETFRCHETTALAGP